MSAPKTLVQTSKKLFAATIRIALANCLQAEYELEKKEIARWLTPGSCE